MFAALSKLASAAHDSRRGTREWPLSPPTCQNLALDRDAFFQLNTSQHCSSILAYGGDIGWTTFGADVKGQVTVSHPAIRWQDLRRSRGWSALQHQSLLRTSLDVPSDMDVFFDLTGAAEMWVEGAKNVLPGDLYQLGNGEQRIRLRRGRYRVAVRQVYDVRQHGDPTAKSEIAPSSSFSLSIGFPDASPLRCMTTHMALPDILLGGRAASDLIGVWVQSQSNEAIEVIKATTDGQEQLSLLVRCLHVTQEDDALMPHRLDRPRLRAGLDSALLFASKSHGRHHASMFTTATKIPSRCALRRASWTFGNRTSHRPPFASPTSRQTIAYNGRWLMRLLQIALRRCRGRLSSSDCTAQAFPLRIRSSSMRYLSKAMAHGL